jgi:hypothetical protein
MDYERAFSTRNNKRISSLAMKSDTYKTKYPVLDYQEKFKINYSTMVKYTNPENSSSEHECEYNKL